MRGKKSNRKKGYLKNGWAWLWLQPGRREWWRWLGRGGGEGRGGTMPRIPTYTLEGGGSILLINGALGRALALGLSLFLEEE
jgi:hypothetical protein